MALLRQLLAIGLAVLAHAALSTGTTASFLNPRVAPNASAATFVYENDDASANLTFSLAAVKSGDDADLYMRLSSPAGQQWVGVGIGRQMKGALMFLVYHDSTGSNVTFSPRIATGENEPSYRSSIDCTTYETDEFPVGVLSNSSDPSDAYYAVNAVCHNVAHLSDPPLDLSSTQQSFIFALGPSDDDLYSNNPAAGIRRHDFYGSFTMDMTRATQDNDTAARTAFGKQMEGATKNGDLREDDDWRGNATHAVFMCGTFLLIFPLAIVFLRVFERVKWHAGAQAAGLLIVIIGAGIGIWLSHFYNHSKKVDSLHQVLGLIVVSLMVVQLGLGWFHHRIYLRSSSPTMMGKIHRYLGPLLFGLGLGNGFIGFRFAGDSRRNIPFLVLVICMFVVLTVVLFLKNRRVQRQRAAGNLVPPPGAPPPYSAQPAPSGPTPGGLAPGGGYAGSQSSRSDIALSDMGGYGHSSRDVYYDSAQPTQPRPMV